ncbi:hypothetical protein RND81_14G143300 [Saponaria officinalis]|uniref:Reverse transcriptase zinc-binding domain-containing protein n=1 Tax=Saponaria officinalis TaxID=3572 RepID=A0AAW1GS82_SAPOF
MAVPKHRFVCWTKRGFSLANRCVLCLNDNESHEHLFFGCPYMHPWSLSRELEWAYFHCNTKRPIHRTYKAALVATVYHGWRERNARIFCGCSMDGDAIIRSVKFDVCCRIYRLASNNTSRRPDSVNTNIHHTRT